MNVFQRLHADLTDFLVQQGFGLGTQHDDFFDFAGRLLRRGRPCGFMLGQNGAGQAHENEYQQYAQSDHKYLPVKHIFTFGVNGKRRPAAAFSRLAPLGTPVLRPIGRY